MVLAAPQVVIQRDLGKAEGLCRPHEATAAFLVEVAGLRDRTGLLKLEVYPATDADFLADDTELVGKGLVFRRVEVATPSSGPVRLCVRLPGPGRYAVSLLHDRNGDHRFNLSSDGIGFASNPKLGWTKPKAASASTIANSGLTPIRIVMNYRHGFSMRPEQ
ncbi:hypothetical protein BRX36_10815 [Sphingomonas sp. S-NIH.Pt1_0416]|nr:DUF2141 domain-containing protein [Sphingomonas sp. S-NIH.Pt1_0416]RSU65271.1 hypothetical protein BRX36_10815 [Sphingomonas sp. S-NIH.Pt1_0416]